MQTRAVGSVVAMETEPNHPDDQANEDDLIDERIMTELAKSAGSTRQGSTRSKTLKPMWKRI